MNKKVTVVVAIILIGIVYSCKENYENEHVSESKEDVFYNLNEPEENISSSAAKVDSKSNRKFVRTADIKFKVKDVAKSTTHIEDVTTKFGGFVTYTNLESNIFDEDKTKISADSTLVTTKYSVENDITIRVPNTQLDTVIKSITKQIDFLNYRKIKADDVTLQFLSNKMAKKRDQSTENRIANAIDTKGEKLNQIVNAEETLERKKENKDNRELENLALEDQINFSTLTLEIYQDDTIKQEMIPNEKSLNSYSPNIGLQILESLKTGWYILKEIILFFTTLWPIIVISILGVIGYKKFFRKVTS